MNHFRTALALIAGVIGMAAASATPASAEIMKGLQDQQMTVNNTSQLPLFFADAEAAGVKMVRFNTTWNGKSKKPKQNEIDGIVNFANQAVNHGITSLMISPKINGSSKFNPKKSAGPLASKYVSNSAYKSYISALASALKGVSLTKYYSPVNEPNWFRHIPRRGGPAHYIKLYRTAYKQIKAIDPNAKVLFGELVSFSRKPTRNYPYGVSTNPGAFVRQALGLNGKWKKTGSDSRYKIQADGIALHTYTYLFKAAASKKDSNKDRWVHGNLKSTRSALRKAAATGRIPRSAVDNIHLTEFSYKNTGADKVSPSKVPTYLNQAWSLAKSIDAKSFVWYQLRDTINPAAWNSGLKRANGTSHPAWDTFVGLK